MKPVLDIEQGKAHSLLLGKTETNPYLLGETNPAPPGSGEAESIPQPSGETEPTLKASGETETSPEPSGEAEPPQRRWARRRLTLSPRARQSYLKRHRERRNQTPVIRTRDETTLLCVQKFLTFGGYWFHLLGYPGIRSPIVAPKPLGDLSRTAWRVFF